MSFVIYEQAWNNILSGNLTPLVQNLKVALLADTYTPTHWGTDAVFADVSAHEVSGTGYTAGGEALVNVQFNIADTAYVILTSDLIKWTGLTVSTVGSAVIYEDSTVNKYLLGFSQTPSRSFVAGTLAIAGFNQGFVVIKTGP